MPHNNDERNPESHGLLTRQSSFEGRTFTISMLLFSNGCFASISEDKSPKMGAITVSIRSPGRVISSPLIPESKGSMLSSMIGELLADNLKGIAVTSMYLKEEIDATGMKTLISEVRKMLAKD